MAPPIKVGLIGYGFSTKCFHLPFILPNPDLQVHAFLQRKAAPADTSHVEAGVHCTIDHPAAKHYRTADAFFGDADIQLVAICTGHDTHFALAKQALLAGKHVVLEKAFTVTSAEADELVALAKERQVVLTGFQNRRYDSDFRTLRKLVDAGAFGKVTEFENHYDVDSPDWVRSWRDPGYVPGSGMLYGLGTHSIDQTLVLFGLPKSVTAFVRSLRMESQTEDSFTIILQYDGARKDLIATVKTTFVSPLPMARQPKFRVRGEQGAFIKTGEDPQIDHLLAGMKPVEDPRFGVEPEGYRGYLHTLASSPYGEFDGVIESEKGSYADYYVDVVAAIRGEREVAVKPEDSRNGIRIIELSRESAAKGVTVPWSEK